MSHAPYIVWWPTFRCQLSCSYCQARGMPVVSHGREREADDWARVFAAAPPLHGFNVCGGEPSLFPLAKAMAGLPACPTHINTNMERDPAEWLGPIANRITSVTASFQYSLGHSRAERYWRHIAALRRLCPTAIICASKTAQPQVDTGADQRSFEDLSRRHGVTPGWHTYSDSLLWREWTWRRSGSATACTGGHDMLAVLPDGSAFRCVGHANAGIHSLGNLVDDGWDVLCDDAYPCHDCLCTLLTTTCDPVTTVYATGHPGDWAEPKPGVHQR